MKPIEIILSAVAGAVVGAMLTASLYQNTLKRQSDKNSVAMAAAAQLTNKLISESDLRYTNDVIQFLKDGKTDIGILWLERFAGNKTEQIKRADADLAKHPEVKVTWTNEPNQRPERNAGATSVSPSTPTPGVAHP